MILFFLGKHLTSFMLLCLLCFLKQYNEIPLYTYSVQFSHSVVSDYLQPHELQHARPPYPSPTLPKPMSIESVMPPSHLIFCLPHLFLPPILPRIRVFSNESTVRMRWPKYWSFSFSISSSQNTQDWSPLGWTGWISLQLKSRKHDTKCWKKCGAAELSFSFGEKAKWYSQPGQQGSFLQRYPWCMIQQLCSLVFTQSSKTHTHTKSTHGWL